MGGENEIWMQNPISYRMPNLSLMPNLRSNDEGNVRFVVLGMWMV